MKQKPKKFNVNWIWYRNSSKSDTKNNFKKVMILVILSWTGIHSITILPPNEKFNKKIFIQGVLEDFSKKVSTRGKFFHCNNARPYLANEKFDELGLQGLEHLPYSQHLAPYDFFLFYTICMIFVILMISYIISELS